MVADTSEELHTMAAKIGVKRKWCQDEGTYREHYDVCLAARVKALKFGAREITRTGLAKLLKSRKP